jgi:hypothetical protein
MESLSGGYDAGKEESVKLPLPKWRPCGFLCFQSDKKASRTKMAYEHWLLGAHQGTLVNEPVFRVLLHLEGLSKA